MGESHNISICSCCFHVACAAWSVVFSGGRGAAPLCHFVQIIWSSLRQIQIDFTVFSPSLWDWTENSTIIVFLRNVGLYIYIYIFLLCGLFMVCVCLPHTPLLKWGLPLFQGLFDLCSHLLWLDHWSETSLAEICFNLSKYDSDVKMLWIVISSATWKFKRLHLFGQGNLEVSEQVIDCETEPCFMFKDKCLNVQSVVPRRSWDKVTVLCCTLPAAFNLSKCLFSCYSGAVRVRQAQEFLSKA